LGEALFQTEQHAPRHEKPRRLDHMREERRGTARCEHRRDSGE